MIAVIDDRLDRQANSLRGKLTHPGIKLLSSREIIDFRLASSENILGEKIKDFSMICVHYSTLFGNDQNAKKNFEQECQTRGIPIVYFSGGYSVPSTIIPRVQYSVPVSILYNRLKQIRPGDPMDDPEFLVFGQGHLLSKLLNLRRKAVILDQNNALDQLLDARFQYSETDVLEIFDKWEQLDLPLNINKVLQSINTVIDQILNRD